MGPETYLSGFRKKTTATKTSRDHRVLKRLDPLLLRGRSPMRLVQILARKRLLYLMTILGSTESTFRPENMCFFSNLAYTVWVCHKIPGPLKCDFPFGFSCNQATGYHPPYTPYPLWWQKQHYFHLVLRPQAKNHTTISSSDEFLLRPAKNNITNTLKQMEVHGPSRGCPELCDRCSGHGGFFGTAQTSPPAAELPLLLQSIQPQSGGFSSCTA